MVLAAEPPEITRGSTRAAYERLGAILVDQVHRALQHLLGGEISVVRIGQKIDK